MLTRAYPRLASMGPSVQMLARMVFTMSYFAWLWVGSVTRIATTPLGAPGSIACPVAVSNRSTPSVESSFTILPMSASSGTSRRITGSSVMSATASMGRAAFLLPLMRIRP